MTTPPALHPPAAVGAARLNRIPAGTVWSEFTPMAKEFGSVNLGQGFPFFSPEQFVTDAAVRSVTDPHPLSQQYAPPRGHPLLIEAVARRYNRMLEKFDLAQEKCHHKHTQQVEQSVGDEATESNGDKEAAQQQKGDAVPRSDGVEEGKDLMSSPPFRIASEFIQITNGTTQALNIIFQALCGPGDEVVVIEPFFDLYGGDIDTAGAAIRFVPLMPPSRPPSSAASNDPSLHPAPAHDSDRSNSDLSSMLRGNDWALDWPSFAAALSSKTKVVLVNSPQNAPGKVWNRTEYERIGELMAEKCPRAFLLSDEVYDRLVYDGIEHVSPLTVQSLREKTLVCSSVGKTFNVTGWKIGWILCAAWKDGKSPPPAPPSENAASSSSPRVATPTAKDCFAPCFQVAALQTFSVCTPMQVATAEMLDEAEENGYYARLTEGYERRREMLCRGLMEAGFEPFVPQGSFFVVASIEKVPTEMFAHFKKTKPNKPLLSSSERPMSDEDVERNGNKVDEAAELDEGDDWAFCRWLTQEIGVTGIPMTAFCRPAVRSVYQRFVRFAFCKTEEDIVQGCARLMRLKEASEAFLASQRQP